MLVTHQRDWKDQLAERLKTARSAIGSQAELAKHAGVSDRIIGLIETGRLDQPPRATTVARLALAVGADPQEWLGIVGREMSEKEVSTLRQTVHMKASMAEIEPAGKIKADIRQETEQRFLEIRSTLDNLRAHIRDFKQPELIEQDMKRLIYQYIRDFDPPDKIRTEIESEFEQRLRREMAAMEPAGTLRRDLMSYVDSRVSELRMLMADINDRVAQIARWQRDLTKLVDVAIEAGGTSEPRKVGRKGK